MSNAILKDHLQGLRSKNEASRIAAAVKLKNYVEKTSREQSKENFATFVEDVNVKLAELINTRDINDRMGVISAIGKTNNFSHIIRETY